MSETVRVEGLRELDKALSELGDVAGFRTLRSAMNRSSTPMLRQAKSNAEATGIKGYDAGATAASMGRWTRKVKPTLTVQFIGPRNKNKKALALWNEKHGKQATRLRHFHLLEFGSINGPAQPFLRPAAEATKGIYIANFRRILAEQIEKTRRKNATR